MDWIILILSIAFVAFWYWESVGQWQRDDKKGDKDKKVILSISNCKDTRVVYRESFLFYGNGINWDGKRRFTELGAEQETLFQQGTVMRITKVYEAKGKIYIDCEVIGQDLAPV